MTNAFPADSEPAAHPPRDAGGETRRDPSADVDADPGPSDEAGLDKSDDIRDDPTTRPRRLTSREHRAETEVFATLAATLVELPPYKLAEIELDPEVIAEVVECRRFRKNARIRQLRRIATQLRRCADIEATVAATADVQRRDSERQRRERGVERWRARLMEEGDVPLSELVAQHPGLDRQHVRQLIRAAKRAPDSGKSQRARRTLLRAIRAASQASAGADAATPAPAVGTATQAPSDTEAPSEPATIDAPTDD